MFYTCDIFNKNQYYKLSTSTEKRITKGWWGHGSWVMGWGFVKSIPGLGERSAPLKVHVIRLMGFKNISMSHSTSLDHNTHHDWFWKYEKAQPFRRHFVNSDIIILLLLC